MNEGDVYRVPRKDGREPGWLYTVVRCGRSTVTVIRCPSSGRGPRKIVDLPRYVFEGIIKRGERL